jgi:hypothetical protein
MWKKLIAGDKEEGKRERREGRKVKRLELVWDLRLAETF